jgi:hypothetical protein
MRALSPKNKKEIPKKSRKRKMPVNPHHFRTSGGTTLATRAGNKPHARQRPLHHQPGPVSQENYYRSSCISLGNPLVLSTWAIDPVNVIKDRTSGSPRRQAAFMCHSTLIKKYYFPYQSDEADHSADPAARPAARHWRTADVEQ